MDLLGEEGEKAAEAVQNLSGRIEELESHLNAVDRAVQDTRNESTETDFRIVRENRERLVQLEGMMKQLTDIQKDSLKDIESERSKENRLKSKLNELTGELQNVKQDQKVLESRMTDIEDKLMNLEKELSNEIQLNQGRIETKVSESEFENGKRELKQEIARLKTSINALADDLEDDKIRVE